MSVGKSSSSSFASNEGDALDELTALFLTGPDPKDIAQQTAVKQPVCRELLLVGNLPVRGGLWLTPYADAIARMNGPTVLARLDLSPPTLELLRFESSLAAENVELSLHEAVTNAAQDVAAWIIRAPGNVKPAELLHLPFDRITILTGEDSAAIVAAYQIIKQLVHSVSESDDEVDMPPIALALAGAGEVAAAEVMERINKAAQSQLGIEIALAACLPRMDSGIKCETFASFGEEGAPSVGELLGWIDSAEGVEAWQGVDVAEEAREGAADSALSEQDERPVLRLAPAIDAHDNDEDVEAETADDVEPWVAATRPLDASSEALKLAPQPSAAGQGGHERAAPAASQVQSLASFVAGLSPLPMRHPDIESIELACDASGGVHVLARENALREAKIVETWARKHRQLLAMASRGVDPQSEITCHVFTDEPAALADLHGTGLRLHVLAPVRVDGRTAWYAAPLNK